MKYYMPTRLVFGPGVFASLAAIVRDDLGARNPLLITDPGLIKAGLADRLTGQLGGVPVFDDVEANPKSTTVNRLGEAARRSRPDLVIALGGGSAIDAAKAVALLATNPGKIEQYEGLSRYEQPPLPLMAIPTTCGTASEVTWVSVITDTERHFKMSIKGPEMFPTVALVDPDLLLTLPSGLVAATGMDALTHAIEAYSVKPANLITDTFALRSIRLIWASLEKAVADIAGNAEAREDLMYGSTLAGFAFGNADVGAVHCISESIGALFDIPHGVANAVFLPHVMRFNVDACSHRYARIATMLGLEESDETVSALKFVAAIEGLSKRLGIPAFKTFGIDKKYFEQIARFSVQNNSNGSNPREAAYDDYMEILEAAYRTED